MSSLIILDLSFNKLKSFNPNYLPDSLTYLNIDGNKLTSFTIERTFKNLIELSLYNNEIKRLTLDLKNKLPMLKKVNLAYNGMQQLNMIDSYNRSHLKFMDLSFNRFDALDVWQWKYENRIHTFVDLNDTFPLCDCSSKELIKDNNEKWANVTKRSLLLHQIVYCRAPLQNYVKAQIQNFPCSENQLTHHSCVEYESVQISSRFC